MFVASRPESSVGSRFQAGLDDGEASIDEWEDGESDEGDLNE